MQLTVAGHVHPGKASNASLQTLLKHGAAVLAPVRSAKGKASLEKDVAGVSADKLQVLLWSYAVFHPPFCTLVTVVYSSASFCVR